MTALKNELRQEREQILQQMGKQRVELEREIEKAKTEENYVRDRLALSLKVAFLLALQPASTLGTHTVLLRSKSPSQTQGSSLPWPGRGGGFASRGLGSGMSFLLPLSLPFAAASPTPQAVLTVHSHYTPFLVVTVGCALLL